MIQLKEIPAISVIIPLYNAEKYIGDCLDSILAQTFQDFEVIVVDDCSTDSSVAVVESYATKFGGRLKFTRMKENSGGAGLPRNKGIELSRGEYLAFVDPDDAITPTAFEEFYTLAKKINADVVHCEKHFHATHEEWRIPERRKLLKPYNYLTKEHRVLSQPILFTNDLEKRLIEFNKRWILWSVCLQMIRRDFVMENNLRFINCYSEDMLFTMCELCCAKRYVMVPNVTYYYLTRDGSATSKEIDPDKNIKKYVGALVQGFRYLEDFFCDNKLFVQRTDLKYLLFDFFFQSMLGRYNEMYKNHPFHFFDEFLRQELSDKDNNELSAYIFNLVALYRIRLIQSRKQIFQLNQFAAAAQKRITEFEKEIRQLKSKE